MWVLRDLGSTNGTTVNGRRVIGAAVVREGDQVGFGQVSYRLHAAEAPTAGGTGHLWPVHHPAGRVKSLSGRWC